MLVGYALMVENSQRAGRVAVEQYTAADVMVVLSIRGGITL
jgi:hypothetical protein